MVATSSRSRSFILGYTTLCLLLLSEMGSAAPSPGYADAQPVGEKTPTVAAILADARQAVDAIPRYSEFSKMSLLLKIANAYALYGDEDSVNTTLQHATDVANSSSNTSNSLLWIATTYVQLGDRDAARVAVERAADIQMRIEGKDGSPELIPVINAYANDLDDLQSANTIFRRVTRPCSFLWFWDLWVSFPSNFVFQG